MAYVPFGHFVGGQIEGRIIVFVQLFEQLYRLGAGRNLDTDEDVRVTLVVVAVVELGDVV